MNHAEPIWGKITEQHQQRTAVVYVRQSTHHQVAEHRESLDRQYALQARATALGWQPSDVSIIDDDLAQSGSCSENRAGFQRLLAEVAGDRIGMVLAIEMSRLARNSRDWHELFELCAIRGTLLADEDGVYDPLDINDRLVLGMKGIISEMELHLIKVRMQRGRENKAARGELYQRIPPGFVLVGEDILLDPDEQVRAAVRLVFEKFRELRTAYALLRYLREYDLRLPERGSDATVQWYPASDCRLDTMLHHPMYAGTYAWGRRRTHTTIDADGVRHRKRSRIGPIESWKVLIHDHHANRSWGSCLSELK